MTTMMMIMTKMMTNYDEHDCLRVIPMAQLRNVRTKPLRKMTTKKTTTKETCARDEDSDNEDDDENDDENDDEDDDEG